MERLDGSIGREADVVRGKARNGGKRPARRCLCSLLAIIVGAALLLACGSAGYAPAPAWAAEAKLNVVSPPDGSWVTTQDLYLVGYLEGDAARHLEIGGVSNKAPREGIPVDEGGAFGVLITLKRGENTITLGSGALQTRLKVFYAPEADSKSVPQGYQRFYVHSNPQPQDCRECHRLRNERYNFTRIIPAQSDCIKCHADMGKASYVHGPVGAGVCISCHNPHGSTNPLSMERVGQDLCLVCHQENLEEFAGAHIHAPVAAGCVDCHNPHESPMRFQLRGRGPDVSSLCFNCHEAAIFTKENRHGPVGSGDCIACHLPHSGEHKNLLIATADKGEVCFQCHQDRMEEFTMRYVHAPVASDCGQCHDPHSSNARFQLYESGGKMCATCHEMLSPEVYNDIRTATYKHEPVDQGKCTECHRAHSSEVQSLLKSSNLQGLCFTCHDELSDHVAGSTAQHGPVITGDCMACHKAHGSTFSRILVRYFPEDFYREYNPEYYDLCFSCHNKDIAKNKFTNTLTNFRDGNYNLHFFHVNMQKGRTCIACHDAHASVQPKHIRTEVPFGFWSYPIALTKTDDGGTCIVGCHAPKGYDRKKPIIEKPAR
ncbi:cytochrome c3 family protein [Desulfurivibrio sp. D14AmB]|uniref:cytochrome c3 family protein n=1 Tax=Desulfurivibrio sp. D14AmB TaxID=3374370 RepID=UPI00376F0BFA